MAPAFRLGFVLMYLSIIYRITIASGEGPHISYQALLFRLGNNIVLYGGFEAQD